jgi:hypothetical protein
MRTLYRVVLPYAVFGIEGRGNTVIEAAPIGRWMVGRSLEYISAWLSRKKGKLEVVKHYE